MKSGELNRTLRRDLLSIFQPLMELPSSNRIGLGDVTLNTKGFITVFPELCARDSLTIRYYPSERSDDFRNVEIEPYAIESEREFAFLRKPTSKSVDAYDKEDDWLPQSTACEKASQRDYEGWFTANSPDLAIEGYLALAVAIEAVRQDKSKLQPCDDNGLRCAELLNDAASLSDLSDIAICEAPEKETCYQVESGLTVITIRAERVLTIPPRGIEPRDIKSVTVEQQIIVT